MLLGSAKKVPDLIILVEVNPKHVKNMHAISEYQLSGYYVLGSGFGLNGYRGILLYYKDDISISELDLSSSFAERLAVKLTFQLMNVLIVYRSPNSSLENDEQLLHLLNEFSQPGAGFLIIGDFNLPDIDWDLTFCFGSEMKIENRFLKFLQDNLLIQHINEPTRYRQNQIPHVLDLLITDKEIIDDIRYLSPLGNSDHSMISFRICVQQSIQKNTVLKPCYDLGKYDDFNEELDTVLPDVINLGVERPIEADWQIFRDSINALTTKFVPLKSIERRSGFSMNPEMRRLVKLKHYYWRQVYRYNDKKMLDEFKKTRRRVKMMTSQLKRRYQDQLSQNIKLNPKLFWNHVKCKTKLRSSIGTLVDGNIEITENKQKATAFAGYFSSVYVEDQKTDSGLFPGLNIDIGEPMERLVIDFQIVSKKLGQINKNKSAGPDGIHSRILFEIKDHIVEYLTYIFNCSLKSGIVVEDWKKSYVIPLFKKGRRESVCNYRPVSLTSICCKLMESIIKDYIVAYFFRNNLFANCQYGFLPFRSTVLQLLKFMDILTNAVDSGDEVDVIYTDLEKAFDKISHERLLFKLREYKVHDEIIRWIRSYLSGRTFQVKIDNDLSDPFKVVSGVPQGSVLGPLLFLIYINDMYKVCNNVFLFADDAKIYRILSDMEDTRNLQNDINSVLNWFDTWRMSVNIDKCFLLHVGRQHHIADYYMVNSEGIVVEIPKKDLVLDLGVFISSDLKFKEHVQHKINKANMMLGIIKRNFKNLSAGAFLCIYKSMVRSHLEYAVQVWSPYNLGLIESLEKVQKRATKLVPACKYMNYNDRLKFLKLPSLSYRRRRGDLILLFNILSGKYEEESFPEVSLCAYERTRGHTKKICTRMSHKDCRKHFFSNRVVGDWNSLPQTVIDAPNVGLFKCLLDDFFGDLRYS